MASSFPATIELSNSLHLEDITKPNIKGFKNFLENCYINLFYFDGFEVVISQLPFNMSYSTVILYPIQVLNKKNVVVVVVDFPDSFSFFLVFLNKIT